MRRSHVLLFGLNAFGTGLLTPVLSLVFLTHGATLQTLSLCIGIFAVFVVLLELPSGILADMIGRKRIFLISALFMTGCYLLLLFSHSFLPLAVSCIFQGIGRAFSSGSIESLEIESYMDRHGKDSLEKINSNMAVIESFGLALGSVSGGLLGFADPSYSLLLLTAAALQISIVLLTIFCVKEPKKERSPLSPALQFRNQLSGLAGALRHSLSVTTVIFMAVPFGMLLAAIEVYWQPTLDSYLPENLSWLFGFVTCLGYLGITLGSKIMEYILTRRKTVLPDRLRWKFYWFLRYGFVLTAISLGFVRRVWLFILLFMLVYAVIGAGNLLENTIFHSSVENSQRASMMSVLSLTLRGGGLGTSLLGSLIVTGLSFSAVWYLLPLSSGLMILVIMAAFYGKYRKVSSLS